MPDSGIAVVCGAGGFIGGHLVRYLLEHGRSRVRAVDVKPRHQWHQCHRAAENLDLDLSELGSCRRAMVGAVEVYNLAADMGGMGFIERNKALCMLNVLINTHLLLAARDERVPRFFYASSACVYNATRQASPEVTPLREEDAYPAMPEDGYGWEKLFSERMCRHFDEDFGLATRVARYHNVYGPFGAYDGGREKAPAAICRKVIEAKRSGHHEIEIWGTGNQTRSFTYIADCLEGTARLTESNVCEPVNVGSSERVTINQLVDMVETIAGIQLTRRYNLSAPNGVNGRNSDNTRVRDLLGWEPTTPLVTGMEATYRWIYDAMHVPTSTAVCA